MHFSTLLTFTTLFLSAFALRKRAEFTLSNGQQAQQLNRQFTSLNADSNCEAGDQACINGSFAQCVQAADLSFSFVVTQCAAGVQCFALPLRNKAGTSIACTTKSDALSRIAETGAQGGLTGNGANEDNQAESPAPAPSQCGALVNEEVEEEEEEVDEPAPTPAQQAPANPSTSFRRDNGLKAQADNERFASLTAESPCTAGENVCVGDSFAQCVDGKLVLTPCGAGTICRALPLVNKAGTSNACTTQADTDARIETALQG